MTLNPAHGPIAKPQITVFGKPHCGQCDMTTKLLDRAKVVYNHFDITADPVQLERIKSLGYLQAPVVLVEAPGHKDEHWSGFRPDKISKTLTLLASAQNTAEAKTV